MLVCMMGWRGTSRQVYLLSSRIWTWSSLTILTLCNTRQKFMIRASRGIPIDLVGYIFDRIWSEAQYNMMDILPFGILITEFLPHAGVFRGQWDRSTTPPCHEAQDTQDFVFMVLFQIQLILREIYTREIVEYQVMRHPRRSRYHA